MNDTSEIPDFDMGVNPKEIFTRKNWEGKGYLTSSSSVNFAVIKTIQDTNFETEDLLSNVVQALTEFSGSIGGKKNELFMQGTGIRLRAEDMKQTQITTGKS